MQQSGENKLLKKFQAGECLPEEQAMIAHYIMYVDVMPQNLLTMRSDLDQLRSRTVGTHIRTRKIIRPARIVTVVASIAILLGFGILILSSDNNQPAANVNDVNPGSDKATLTLANGPKINLSDARSGSLLNPLGIEIIKTKDGSLVYKVASKLSTSKCNTITTPKGGQYKIVLSDGTRGWLNAASSLSYSTSSKVDRGERKVSIVGEAYFEVYKMISDIGRRV